MICAVTVSYLTLSHSFKLCPAGGVRLTSSSAAPPLYEKNEDTPGLGLIGSILRRKFKCVQIFLYTRVV